VARSVDLSYPSVADLLARCAFGPERHVSCAVSGGADSLTLLVLAAASGRQVHAIHVDHGLRAGSDAEAQVVAEVAAAVGAGFRAERAVVAPGPNLEARARAARFAVLPPGVLTGHTADDRAETVVLNLLRGAGPGGLVGIRRGPTKPLLDLRRSETVGLCGSLGLTAVDDPSNVDPAHRRNRVRHEVLPLLAEVGDRDPVPVLVRQADLLAEVDAALGARAAGIDPTSAAALRRAPAAEAGEAVRAWLRAEGVGEGHPPSRADVGRVLAVAHHEQAATEVAGGWRVARTGDVLRLDPPARRPG
jgi:tRNA(Ile)-lysidine synthase